MPSAHFLCCAVVAPCATATWCMNARAIVTGYIATGCATSGDVLPTNQLVLIMKAPSCLQL
eukprot:scaffold266817_cov31-Tisochrysis_lutea.AAC.1